MPYVWHIWGGIFLANMGGGGGQNYFHEKTEKGKTKAGKG